MPSTKSETKQKFSWQFEALGTHWELASSQLIDTSLRTHVGGAIDSFDKTYSRFRDDSLVSDVSKVSGVYTFPQSVETLFDFYDSLYDLTGGKVTPLVGDTLSTAGYDKDYSLRPQREVMKAKDYKQTISRDGLVLKVSDPTMIDIGAIGKGYLVDQLTQIMNENGHDDFIVDGSGDMRVVGKRLEVIGLEDPRNIKEVIGTVEVGNMALCASAVNRRAWRDWHHIIDPETSRPTYDVIATWVVADSAMIADGLATALFFTSPKKLATTYNYEYLRVHANGSIEYSEYFAKGVF